MNTNESIVSTGQLLAQKIIAKELGVTEFFDAQTEINMRVNFLVDYMKDNKCKALVLGISGGIDSTVAGIIAQKAVDVLRAAGKEAQFIAVRLPYGVQRDEVDAQTVLSVINPDDVITVNIAPACDAIMTSMKLDFYSVEQSDFVLGNIKARQRMVVQYAIAGAEGGLVVGTDHAAEALMGFFTKFGDGAADVTPLSGLTKRRVRAIATFLGVPDTLTHKTPTADLESLNPGKPDEEAFGVTYENIDDFLESHQVTPDVFNTIFEQFVKTMHKRCQPARPMK